ncbi:hypothetical protein P170DRAFT_422411 [Aspergillus steynii IBT 23096]|uniref:Uncharacterized protein n=1 Tax=Aspergillus steynii IBT 23096 TaxID=1392250 RepID=A0A2I2GST1_9EURO|nr:uncharacterized protein P170DRAFT_422411 [Aspergillus steynii IBT 23096]PLB55925.1 hypothetical protein P170DRAFT_422411 [Aspergillus steynii IBT 23096]
MSSLSINETQLRAYLTQWITTADSPSYFETVGIPPEIGYRVARSLCDDGDVENCNPNVTFNPTVGRLSIRMSSNPRASVPCWVLYEELRAVRSGVFSRAELEDFDIFFNGDIWLQCGAPHVNAVLLVMWHDERDKEVAGSLEIHCRDGTVSPRVQIFPVPPSQTSAQTVTWYRKDFYPGGVVPDGRNPNDVWNWNLDKLRYMATRSMAIQGLRPAEALS